MKIRMKKINYYYIERKGLLILLIGLLIGNIFTFEYMKQILNVYFACIVIVLHILLICVFLPFIIERKNVYELDISENNKIYLFDNLYAINKEISAKNLHLQCIIDNLNKKYVNYEIEKAMQNMFGW